MKLVFSAWDGEKVIEVSTMKEAIPVIIEEAEYDENGNKNEDWEDFKNDLELVQDMEQLGEKISSYFCNHGGGNVYFYINNNDY